MRGDVSSLTIKKGAGNLASARHVSQLLNQREARRDANDKAVGKAAAPVSIAGQLLVVALTGPHDEPLRERLQNLKPQLSRAMGSAGEFIMLGDPNDSSDEFCVFAQEEGVAVDKLGSPEWKQKLKRYGDAQAVVSWETEALVHDENVPAGDVPCLLLTARGRGEIRDRVVLPRGLTTTDFGLRSLSDVLLECLASDRIAARLTPLLAMPPHEAQANMTQFASALRTVLRTKAAIVECEPADARLSAVDREVLRLLAKDPAKRLTGPKIAHRLGRKLGTIGKNLAALARSGLIDSVKRKGYRITPRGLAALD